MLLKLLRFTPRRTLTYKNRWYHPVKPKHTLFFIPPDKEQVKPWLDFLCTKHHRTFLYIHVVELRVVRYKVRVLKVWKGFPLVEVMIRTRDYVKRKSFKMQRVLHRQKALPRIVRQYIK